MINFVTFLDEILNWVFNLCKVPGKEGKSPEKRVEVPRKEGKSPERCAGDRDHGRTLRGRGLVRHHGGGTQQMP